MFKGEVRAGKNTARLGRAEPSMRWSKRSRLNWRILCITRDGLIWNVPRRDAHNVGRTTSFGGCSIAVSPLLEHQVKLLQATGLTAPAVDAIGSSDARKINQILRYAVSSRFCGRESNRALTDSSFTADTPVGYGKRTELKIDFHWRPEGNAVIASAIEARLAMQHDDAAAW